MTKSDRLIKCNNINCHIRLGCARYMLNGSYEETTFDCINGDADNFIPLFKERANDDES